MVTPFLQRAMQTVLLCVVEKALPRERKA